MSRRASASSEIKRLRKMSLSNQVTQAAMAIEQTIAILLTVTDSNDVTRSAVIGRLIQELIRRNQEMFPRK